MTDSTEALLSELRAASGSDDYARNNQSLKQAIEEIVRLKAAAAAVGQSKPEAVAEIDEGSLTFRDGSLSVTVLAETAVVYDAEKPIPARKVPLGEGFWKAAEDILGDGQVRPGSGTGCDGSAGEAGKLREEISRLREIVRRYGDRSRMSMAPAGLQEAIDAAMAEAAPSSVQDVPSPGAADVNGDFVIQVRADDMLIGERNWRFGYTCIARRPKLMTNAEWRPEAERIVSALAFVRAFPADLRERCRELIEWWSTGILEPGSALERLADEKFAGFGEERIRMAERATLRELCRISAAPELSGSQKKPRSDRSDGPDAQGCRGGRSPCQALKRHTLARQT